MHYRRWSNHGDPLTRKKSANGTCKNGVCAVPECGKVGRGTVAGVVYCAIHFDRAYRHGDPLKVLRIGNGQTTKARKKKQAAESQRRYLKTPHGRLRSRFNAGKKRAIQHGCDWATGFTKEVFLELYARPNCGICGVAFAPDEDRWIDHIIPLARGGPNHPNNLQPAHPLCNMKKNDQLPGELVV